MTYGTRGAKLIAMKSINWNLDKNQQLLNERRVSFEDVVVCIQQGELLDIIEHPNKEKYPNQRVFVIEIDNYAFLIPYVETDEEIFLKTIIPSRKATKIYLGDK
uniref:BrnT family toxin n=1 Tax=Ningiella ruwaisensis TaxID=2364274 RepID=UPI001F4FE648|nr:BrnT family toxin [Ningiella ruwaisensis]